VTYNPDFKVTIIQRQITRKWYHVELCLRRPTNSKSYMIYRTAPFSMTLNDPTPAEYLRNGTRYRQFQWNTNEDLHMPYNDRKRRAVSLRQLSLLNAQKNKNEKSLRLTFFHVGLQVQPVPCCCLSIQFNSVNYNGQLLFITNSR